MHTRLPCMLYACNACHSTHHTRLPCICFMLATHASTPMHALPCTPMHSHACFMLATHATALILLKGEADGAPQSRRRCSTLKRRVTLLREAAHMAARTWSLWMSAAAAAAVLVRASTLVTRPPSRSSRSSGVTSSTSCMDCDSSGRASCGAEA